MVKRLAARSREHDWEHSHPLDLTDEGLLADLEKRNEAGDGADKLALARGGTHKGHKGKKR